MMLNGAVRVSTLGRVPVRVSAPLVGDFFQGLSGDSESVAIYKVTSEIAGPGEPERANHTE